MSGVMRCMAHLSFSPSLKNGDEPMIRCAYDRSHVVRRSRYGNHILKCRQAWLNRCKDNGYVPDMVQCRYNHHHLYYELEYGFHYDTCPNYGHPLPRTPTPPPRKELSQKEIWDEEDRKAEEEAEEDAMWKREADEAAEKNKYYGNM